MKHCSITHELKAWLDGELAVARAEAVARHVDACARCRETVRAFRGISRRVGSAVGAPLPICDARRLRHGAVAARRDEESFLRFLQGVAATAAAVCVVSTALLVASFDGAPAPGSTDPGIANADAARATIDPEYPYAREAALAAGLPAGFGLEGE